MAMRDVAIVMTIDVADDVTDADVAKLLAGIPLGDGTQGYTVAGKTLDVASMAQAVEAYRGVVAQYQDDDGDVPEDQLRDYDEDRTTVALDVAWTVEHALATAGVIEVM